MIVMMANHNGLRALTLFTVLEDTINPLLSKKVGPTGPIDGWSLTGESEFLLGHLTF
jgi:hypothetical protein